MSLPDETVDDSQSSTSSESNSTSSNDISNRQMVLEILPMMCARFPFHNDVSKTLEELNDKQDDIESRIAICAALVEFSQLEVKQKLVLRLKKVISDSDNDGRIRAFEITSKLVRSTTSAELVKSVSDMLTKIHVFSSMEDNRHLFNDACITSLLQTVATVLQSSQRPSSVEDRDHFESMCQTYATKIEKASFAYISRLKLASYTPIMNTYCSDIELQLRKHVSAKDMRTRASFVALCHLAATIESTRNFLLFELVKRYQITEYSGFVVESLSYLAKQAHADVFLHLLNSSSVDILFHWVESREDLTKLPFTLFGEASLGEFVRKKSNILLPFLVKNEMTAQIEFVAKTNKMDMVSILLLHSAPIYTFSMLSSLTGNPKPLQYFKSVCKTAEQKALADVDQVLACALTQARNATNVSLPYFTTEHVKSLFQLFAGKASVPSFLKSTKSRISTLLLSVIESLHEAQGSKKVDVFNTFTYIVQEFLGENIGIENVLRFVIQIVLQGMQSAQLHQSAAQLLINILEKANMDSKWYAEFGKKYKQIIHSAVVALCANPTTDVKEAMMKVLKRLILMCPEPLKPFMKELTLPSDATFADYETAIQTACAKDDIFGEVKLFLGKTISGYEVAGLARICRQVKDKKNSLTNEVQSDQSGTKKQLATQLVSKLLQLCSGQYSELVKKEAGSCLSELGLAVPVKSFSMLNPDENSLLYKEFEFDDIASRIVSENWQLDAFKMEAKKSILQLLNLYLSEKNVEIVKLTVQTLRSILTTTSGKKALSHLDSSEQYYFEPFENYGGSTLNVEIINCNALQLPKEYSDHSAWVKTVCSALLRSDGVQDEVFKLCSVLAMQKDDFAEHLFTMAIMDIAESAVASQYQPLLTTLFEKQVFSNLNCDTKTIRLVIFALNVLCRNSREKLIRNVNAKVNKQYWITTPYDQVASAAVRSKAYYTGLMYSEMHYESNFHMQPLTASFFFDMKDAPQAKIASHQLLLDIYKHIDEPDSIYGINRGYGIQAKMFKYEHEGEWEKALGSFDILLQLQNTDSSLYTGALNALQNLGYQYTMGAFVNSTPAAVVIQHNVLNDKFFEHAWRNLDNSLPSVLLSSSNQDDFSFHKCIYMCMQAMKNKDTLGFTNYHALCKKSVIATVGSDMHNALTKLHLLSELKDAWTITSKSHKDSDIKFIGKQGLGDQPFERIEPVLALRSSLLQLLNKSELLQEHMCEVASLARKDNKLHLASTLVQRVQVADKTLSHPRWILEEAKILWQQGETDAAINTGKYLLHQIKATDPTVKVLYGSASCAVGKWLGHTQSEGVKVVREYLTQGVNHLTTNRSKAYYSLAKYLDQLYLNQIRNQKSQTFANAKDLRKQYEKLHDEYHTEYENHRRKKTEFPKDLLRTYRNLQKVVAKDKNDDDLYGRTMNELLLHTLENYGLASKHGTKYDTYVLFRVCSLWFNNADNEAANKKFKDLFTTQAIASYKFLPLTYQIASRIGKLDTTFHKVTFSLLEMVASQHPYHALYHIFALKNGAQVSGKDDKEQVFVQVDKEKIKVAEELLQKLKSSTNVKLKSIIENMSKLTDAYKDVAFWSIRPEDYKNNTHIPMSSSMKLQSIKDMSNIPVTTLELEVKPDAKYEDYPSIVGFEKNISLCGGINVPKIVKCRGSDGVMYRQLVKGKDDLRQDAVMQQIFILVNNLLQENKETRQRALRIRTYKCIPLTPNSGLLGWVENTQPLAEYLVRAH